MKQKILFVCHGNVCRSPTGHAILQKLQPNWIVDSAGTHAELSFSNAHPKTLRVAKHYGIDINHKPQQFQFEDLNTFDYILVSDPERMQDVLSYCQNDTQKIKVQLLGDFHEPKLSSIPDPYYELNFDEVFHIIENCCENFIKSIK